MMRKSTVLTAALATLGAIILFSTPSAAAPLRGKMIKEPVTAAACKREPGRTHYVEFRSRTAASYGHSFVLFGKLGPGEKFASVQVAGLHPRGDDPAVYMQGHVVPVPSETGASDGDLDEQYLTARFCVVLTEADYNRITGFIRRLQARETEWHAPTKNCNWFIGEIASELGLIAPPTPILYPETYVNAIKDMNEGSFAELLSAGRSKR
jgi:hypothetical protein